jgi:hypothetical protein
MQPAFSQQCKPCIMHLEYHRVIASAVIVGAQRAFGDEALGYEYSHGDA